MNEMERSRARVIPCVTSRGPRLCGALWQRSSRLRKFSMLRWKRLPTACREKRAELEGGGDPERTGGRRRRIDITRAAVDAHNKSLRLQVFEPAAIRGSGLSIHFQHCKLFLLESGARVRSTLRAETKPPQLHAFESFCKAEFWLTSPLVRAGTRIFSA